MDWTLTHKIRTLSKQRAVGAQVGQRLLGIRATVNGYENFHGSSFVVTETSAALRNGVCEHSRAPRPMEVHEALTGFTLSNPSRARPRRSHRSVPMACYQELRCFRKPAHAMYPACVPQVPDADPSWRRRGTARAPRAVSGRRHRQTPNPSRCRSSCPQRLGRRQGSRLVSLRSQRAQREDEAAGDQQTGGS